MRARRGTQISAKSVPKYMAREMARVGIVPSAEGPDEEPIGHSFEMAGQRFVVIGYATREEFIAAANREGLPELAQCPQHYNFQRISTD